MCKISVIIPCYNVEKYLDKCVSSLLTQSLGLEHLELIFVNDASTDGTLGILLDYERNYKDVICVVDLPENRRQGGARNVGLQYATGDYIGFVDADDYIDPEMYEKLLKRIMDDSSDMAICGRYEEKVDGSSVDLGGAQDLLINLEEEEFKYFLLHAQVYHGIVQCLYRRELLERAQISFPEKKAYEDNYWSGILIYYVNRVSVLKKSFYHYRINETSTIQQRNAGHHLDRLDVELSKVKELKSRKLFEKYREDIEYQFVMLYFVNTLVSLINKFDEIPECLIERMQNTVNNLFPDWRENILLQNYTTLTHKKMVHLLDYSFEKGTKEEVIYALSQSET